MDHREYTVSEDNRWGGVRRVIDHEEDEYGLRGYLMGRSKCTGVQLQRNLDREAIGKKRENIAGVPHKRSLNGEERVT